MNFPRRGEIYMLEWHAVAGSELEGWHPALIVQNDTGNEVSPTTIIVGITSKMRAARLPHVVLIEPSDSGLPRRSLIHCGQLTTVDKSRLAELVGRLRPERMRDVDQALLISLG